MVIILLLPDLSRAAPVRTSATTKHNNKPFSSDMLLTILSSLDKHATAHNIHQRKDDRTSAGPKLETFNNVQQKLQSHPNSDSPVYQQFKDAFKKNLWNSKLLAMALYDTSQMEGRSPVRREKQVALYDPLGGGIWGKKKRSIEDEYQDFDYEGDDL